MLSLVACNKSSPVDDIDACILTTFPNATLLSEEDKGEACIYMEVHRYQDEITYVHECCVCDLAYILYHCDGTEICDFEAGCHAEFFANAEYLYAINTGE